MRWFLIVKCLTSSLPSMNEWTTICNWSRVLSNSSRERESFWQRTCNYFHNYSLFKSTKSSLKIVTRIDLIRKHMSIIYMHLCLWRYLMLNNYMRVFLPKWARKFNKHLCLWRYLILNNYMRVLITGWFWTWFQIISSKTEQWQQL